MRLQTLVLPVVGALVPYSLTSVLLHQPVWNLDWKFKCPPLTMSSQSFRAPSMPLCTEQQPCLALNCWNRAAPASSHLLQGTELALTYEFTET